MNSTQIREIAQNAAKVALCAYFKKPPTELFKKGFGNSKTQLDAVIAVIAVLEKVLNAAISQTNDELSETDIRQGGRQ